MFNWEDGENSRTQIKEGKPLRFFCRRTPYVEAPRLEWWVAFFCSGGDRISGGGSMVACWRVGDSSSRVHDVESAGSESGKWPYLEGFWGTLDINWDRGERDRGCF
jgi:hypothetical protein